MKAGSGLWRDAGKAVELESWPWAQNRSAQSFGASLCPDCTEAPCQVLV